MYSRHYICYNKNLTLLITGSKSESLMSATGGLHLQYCYDQACRRKREKKKTGTKILKMDYYLVMTWCNAKQKPFCVMLVNMSPAPTQWSLVNPRSAI